MIDERQARKNKVLAEMRRETKILQAETRKNFVKNYMAENFGKNGFYSKLSTFEKERRRKINE
jgi:hypothetical protein